MNRKNPITATADRVVEYILSLDIEELEDITVGSIARNLKVSRSQLWRSFKKARKITIEEYLCKMKIIQAAEMLRDKNGLTVKEIAEKMGYWRCDYFIRIFKQFFGTTPGKYRQLRNGFKG